MLDPKKIAAMEQEIASIREFLPRGLRAMYEGCQEEGFTQQEAFFIALKWMEFVMTGGGNENCG